MKYVEALTNWDYSTGLYKREKSIFLAGGITNCPDWQQEMVQLLKDTDLTLLNPRRKHFPIDNPNAALEQIKWEHYYLDKATAILFWFPCETLCPIVLYELGVWAGFDEVKPVFIGVHPNYKRRQDVEIQMKLAQPYLPIVCTLEDLANQVIIWGEGKNSGTKITPYWKEEVL